MPLITATGGGSVRGLGRGLGRGKVIVNIPPSLESQGTEVFYSLNTQVTLSTPGIYYTRLSSGSSISLNLHGARGGNGGNTPGSGGIVSGQCNLSSIPDGYLVFVVGGRGGQGGESAGTIQPGGTGYLIPGGFNGGGIGVDNSASRSQAAGGGGASDVRISFGVSETDYNGSIRILVAGGGGGSTANGGATGGSAGWPNGSAAANAAGETPGQGGTQSSGGSIGGQLGVGGSRLTNTGWNGGGGGGWYGGGAPTQHIGAGGGSSYYDPSFIFNFSHGTSGTGNGLIEFTVS